MSVYRKGPGFVNEAWSAYQRARKAEQDAHKHLAECQVTCKQRYSDWLQSWINELGVPGGWRACGVRKTIGDYHIVAFVQDGAEGAGVWVKISALTILAAKHKPPGELGMQIKKLIDEECLKPEMERLAYAQ